MTEFPRPKIPVLAAVLNLLPLPFGYAYLGYERRFYLALLLRILAFSIGAFWFVVIAVNCAFDESCNYITFEEIFINTLMFPLLIPTVVLIYQVVNVFSLARRHD